MVRRMSRMRARGPVEPEAGKYNMMLLLVVLQDSV